MTVCHRINPLSFWQWSFTFSTIGFSGCVPFIPKCWDLSVMASPLYGIFYSHYTNFVQVTPFCTRDTWHHSAPVQFRHRSRAPAHFRHTTSFRNHQASTSFRFLGSFGALISLVLFLGSEGPSRLCKTLQNWGWCGVATPFMDFDETWKLVMNSQIKNTRTLFEILDPFTRQLLWRKIFR